MKNSSAFKTMLSDFLNINAETTLSVAIIGSIFAGKTQITYHYFFAPVILSTIYMLPCVPIYFLENMTIKQVIFQRVAELIVVEAATICAAFILAGSVMPAAGYIAVGISVFAFDILTYLLQWYLEKNTADKINGIIKEMRKKNKRN